MMPMLYATTSPGMLAQFGSGAGYGIFAGMMFFGLILLALLSIFGIASLVGLVYIWVRALKQPALAMGLANCGRCGYGVRGATSMACPECGADFREVGIVSPSMRKTFISPALFIVLWTLCLWLPGCMVSGVAVSVGPQQQVHYEDVDLDPPDKAAAGYDNIMLSRTPYAMYAPASAEFLPQESRYVDVDIYGPNGNEWYEVDTISNTYENLSGSVSNPQPFDRAKLESWITIVGGDAKNTDVQNQIDQIYVNISQTQTVGLSGNHWSAFSVNSQNSWSEDQPATWFMLVQPIFWIIVYFAGVAGYFLLKKRYDDTMSRLRDEALAYDAQASPELQTPPMPPQAIESPTQADP